MKKATIEIRAKFGSKFQERFAMGSLMTALEAWRKFLNSFDSNDVVVIINGDDERNLAFFNWINYRKGQKHS